MDGSQKESENAREERLERYAALALEWPSVRELYLSFAPSPLGRRALEELVPRSEQGAREALARAWEMQELGESPPLEGGADPLPGLDLAARYRRVLSAEELAGVTSLLRRMEVVGHWLAGRAAELPACGALWKNLPDVADLMAELEAHIDRRGKVRRDASPALEKAHREIEGLERSIERTIKEVAGRTPRSVLAEGPAGQVHRRGGRLVLAVRARLSGRVPGVIHDRSQTGETVFVEPHEACELGNRVQERRADLEREVARILSELTRVVLGRTSDIATCSSRLGELELALVSAGFAAHYGGRPARLPGDPGAHPGLVLRAMRHPLLLEQESLGRLAEVVPLDLRLGAHFDLLLITGPNTGGKTLALKSAGLAGLLTRMGLAFPCAEGTSVPLYDGIVADIGDEQEIQQNLSTFSSHLKRIRDGLAWAGTETLFLLDELGGGTDPTEGAALGDAILEELLAKGASTLASTHLGRLKEFAFRHDRAENAHVEFDLATLAPRYSVVIGAPGESRALAVAQRLGFPEKLVEGAKARVERRSGEVEELMEEVRRVRIDAERQRSKADDRVHELEEKLRAVEEQSSRLSEREGQLEAEAQRGLEERLTRARAWVERLRAALPQLPAAQREKIEGAVLELEGALGDALLTDRRQDFLARLKKGELVWLPRYKKRCQVTRIYRDKRELDVRLGKRDLRVGFDDVTFYESL